MSVQTKSVNLKSGGSVILTIDGSLLDLSPSDRDFIFGLIDRLREYEGDDSRIPATTEPVQTEAIHDSPFRCSNCGGPRSATAASRCSDCWKKQVALNAEKRKIHQAEIVERKRLREKRNQERQATWTEVSGIKPGQRFGSLVVEEIKKEKGSANRPFFARCRCDCGGTRQFSIEYLVSAFEPGDSLACVECDRKRTGQAPVEQDSIQIAAEMVEQGATVNTAAETIGIHRNTLRNRIKAITEEVKRKTVSPAPVVLPDAPAIADESEGVRNLARRLFKQHLDQCHKLNVSPDSSFAEFLRNAREIIEWERNNPGKKYVERYNGKVPSEDFVKTNYKQQYSAR